MPSTSRHGGPAGSSLGLLFREPTQFQRQPQVPADCSFVSVQHHVICIEWCPRERAGVRETSECVTASVQ